MKLKDVLVTGGSGFIGRRLCRRLSEAVPSPYRVVPLSSKDVNLADSTGTFAWWARELRNLDVSHIFHLAAVYKAGGWPATHPATQFHLNMALNVNVLEAWKRYAPGARMASVVSYCMYPDHDRPHPETEMYGTEPEQYLYAYAFTKKALVIGQRAYCQEFGLSAVSGVLPTIYGPGDSFSEDSHVMGALIGKFCRAVDDGLDRVEVWGDGHQEREFLYVDDAVDGILAAAHRGVSPCLNMGSGRAVAIRTLAELIG
ncbi:MAG: NAD-dependent epimerase/dehydratase family protein, partial [Vicinamibacterales bacterium]|nr:NAD-dependent epimerase/dehydratase family protein [Vicinamibacterales bacterium]